MQQGRYGEAVGIVILLIPIDGEIDHSQESIRVHILFLAHLTYGLVAKTKVNAETAQTLEDIVIVTDNADQLVVSLIHLLILHLLSPINKQNLALFVPP